MFRIAVLLGGILIGCLGVKAGGIDTGDDVQRIVPGIDTLAPTLENISVDCAIYEFEAAELRNTPDPPSNPPGSKDQIDRGIASITITGSPSSVNARLVLVTDSQFPLDPSYKRFRFRIEPIDPTKQVIAFVWIRDWADNAFARQIVIDPPIPSPSTDLVEVAIRVDTKEQSTVTLTNTTTKPQTITSITIGGSDKFEIISGGSNDPLILAPGETRDIVVEYSPDLSSENGDYDAVTVLTP